MNTHTLNDKRRHLQEQIEALAKKQPQATSARFVLALGLAGVVLFGGLAATFYLASTQRASVAAAHEKTSQALFNTHVEGAGQVQVNNLNR